MFNVIFVRSPECCTLPAVVVTIGSPFRHFRSSKTIPHRFFLFGLEDWLKDACQLSCQVKRMRQHVFFSSKFVNTPATYFGDSGYTGTVTGVAIKGYIIHVTRPAVAIDARHYDDWLKKCLIFRSKLSVRFHIKSQDPESEETHHPLHVHPLFPARPAPRFSLWSVSALCFKAPIYLCCRYLPNSCPLASAHWSVVLIKPVHVS